MRAKYALDPSQTLETIDYILTDGPNSLGGTAASRERERPEFGYSGRSRSRLAGVAGGRGLGGLRALAQSSSMIVPVPRFLVNSELLLLSNRSR